MFLDIETVPGSPEFDDLPENFKHYWDKKSSNFRKEDQSAADVYNRAGIYAEFGKIICISVGVIHDDKLRVKSFASDGEKELLLDFAKMIDSWDSTNEKYLCGHNVKEFDIPYISRRMLINEIKLPPVFDISGKKPWEIRHIDTLELWKFGDYKNFTSLSLLADLFNIPTSKDDIDGSMVCEVYYKEKDLQRIVKYCEKDVLCVANLVLKLMGKDLIKEIVSV
ncbi:MAG TPA: 3'-5' exonuclease [Bacteroidales bacterium]|nr:3'-5' exonuclease [Bacteroidales bacterium]HOL97913.1 3'-5' exonuclease [Bacteroidales bacterium]HPD22782.1 3'-5' exonuclease [Bacteroidales bacterium]HRS98955.1 3'-5' exonuclease [Bacteroidales bacterium]HRT81351.1 3'-5' exonuclease [Bacteroidales bacterium]